MSLVPVWEKHVNELKCFGLTLGAFCLRVSWCPCQRVTSAHSPNFNLSRVQMLGEAASHTLNERLIKLVYDPQCLHTTVAQKARHHLSLSRFRIPLQVHLLDKGPASLDFYELLVAAQWNPCLLLQHSSPSFMLFYSNHARLGKGHCFLRILDPTEKKKEKHSITTLFYAYWVCFSHAQWYIFTLSWYNLLLIGYKSRRGDDLFNSSDI